MCEFLSGRMLGDTLARHLKVDCNEADGTGLDLPAGGDFSCAVLLLER